jgi:hypothetical protein
MPSPLENVGGFLDQLVRAGSVVKFSPLPQELVVQRRCLRLAVQLLDLRRASGRTDDIGNLVPHECAALGGESLRDARLAVCPRREGLHRWAGEAVPHVDVATLRASRSPGSWSLAAGHD